MRPLNRDLWSRLSPLLDRAFELDAAGCAELLAGVRAEDPELAEALEALLARHRLAAASDFLESTPLGDRLPVSMEGQTVGGYTLVRPLGMGGMGTVWLARRSDGRFEGDVAVKFVNLAVLDELTLERFRREGTVLARLSHPHIARLFDAGMGDSGQPYLVLEYVEGTRIDRYAAEQRLGVTGRLELFLQVADAVAHAHANLVVHRDLKPSNILVDRHGQAKLLDFGVSTLLGSESAGGPSTLTLAGSRALTPEHAAPEQLAGGVVTTATDVYALGVLLYQSLSGCHPTGSDTGTPAAVLRAVIEHEPRRLSEAVRLLRAGDPETQRILTERDTTGDRLRRACRGDLDTILGKALQKDPAARYQTVTALADDIRRHLRHEPIAARPDAVPYRVLKFVRRNWLATAAAAAIVAALSAGLYATNRQRALAERRFSQVRQLANRVITLEQQIRPLPGSTKARYEIVAMAKDYLEALRPDAEADLDLALEVGQAYSRLGFAQGVPTASNLGQHDEAGVSLRAAGALLDAVIAREPGHRRALFESANVHVGRMILADSAGRKEEAFAEARAAVARLDAVLALGAPTPAEAERAVGNFSNIALAHKNDRRHPEAIGYARRALAILPPGPHRARAQNLSIIADSLRLSGNLDEALRTIRDARRHLEEAPDSGIARMLLFFSVLWREGVILAESGRVGLGGTEQAIAVLQQAFDHVEGWAAKDADDAQSRLLFASAGRELGDLLRPNDPRRALAVYDHALRRLGEVKDNVRARRGEIDLLAGSSYALRRLGDAGEAQRRLDAAFERLRGQKLYPSDRVRLGSESDAALRALADHQAETGRLAEAIATCDRLHSAVSAAGPAPEADLDAADDLSRLYETMASLHARAGNEAAAVALAGRRVELWERWNRTLPGSAFVSAQLAAARAP